MPSQAVAATVAAVVNNRKGRGPSSNAGAVRTYCLGAIEVAKGADTKRASVALDANERFSTYQLAFKAIAAEQGIRIAFHTVTRRDHNGEKDGEIASFQVEYKGLRSAVPATVPTPDAPATDAPTTEGDAPATTEGVPADQTTEEVPA